MTAPIILILAAGRGERFRAAGGTGHKLSAMLAGTTVLDRTVAQAVASGLMVHVVSAPTPGMGWSIAAGVRATPDAGGWLILPGDMPVVSPDTIRRVATALSTAPAVQPLYGDRPGHPVGFARQCRDALLTLSGDAGARSVIATVSAITLTTDDPGCVLDVDTPADLVRAEHLAATSPPSRDTTGRYRHG